jgi:2Fe-2S ferredoxin
VFHLADGTTRAYEASPGESLMDCALDHAVPGIRGQCGGGCTCGTCHCWIDAPWRTRVPPADAGEEELLAFLPDVRAESRLACRIVLDGRLDGLSVTLPPDDVSG